MDISCLPAVVQVDSIEHLKQRLDEAQDQRGVIFRGHADSAWSLVPSAWRVNSLVHKKFIKILKQHAERDLLNFLPDEIRISVTKDASDDHRRRMSQLCAHLLAEQIVVGDFCERCDRIALKVPAFDRPGKFPPWMSSGRVPGFEFDASFAFAQHFGIPTRLLDFSENPLKALFFAASGYRPPGLLGDAEGRFSVIMASHAEESDSDRSLIAGLGRPVGIRRVLRAEIPYLHVQDGLFLEASSFANHMFFSKERWPTFEEMMVGWQVEKLDIRGALAPEILDLLHRRGIDEITMKPSYEGVAESMRRVP